MATNHVRPSVGEPEPGAASNAQRAKVIVAVHGIGDQFNYATVQTVAFRFCSFLGLRPGIPLGSFHAKQVGETGAFLLESSELSEQGRQLYFAEAYWADVPRERVAKGHTLEEAKKWARTIVERLQSQCAQGEGLGEKEYVKVKSVLQEMIETLSVLERLCFLAEKAGVFKFDLNKVLVDYLGDVQIVTDFEDDREKILGQFFEVMKKVRKNHPEADIYIVAHSEGTVVSFLGLLKALSEHKTTDDDWEWVEKVRGLMTIGSPIDKHLILWPKLWEQFESEQGSNRHTPTKPIEWRNFYDYGDPIGFELNTAREWMKKHRWLRPDGAPGAFNFKDKEHDIGFSRYWFPGKAHNDYWQDEELFGHFIETVVREEPKDSAKQSAFKKAPGSKFLPRLTTKVIPYLIVTALIFLAVYFLYKAVATAGLLPHGSAATGGPSPDESAVTIFRNVLGLSSLLLGVTLMARLPRLSKPKYGILLGMMGFGACAAIYYLLVPFGDSDTENRFDAFARCLVGGLDKQLPFQIPPLILLAALVVVVVYTLNHVFPKWGLYALMIPVFLVVIAMTIHVCPSDPGMPSHNDKPLWPVWLALAGFLYLWWLAALLLDLVIVWRWYIRNSLAMDRLRDMAGWGEMSKKRRYKHKRPVPAYRQPSPSQGG
jgi:hypothetical protein